MSEHYDNSKASGMSLVAHSLVAEHAKDTSVSAIKIIDKGESYERFAKEFGGVAVDARMKTR